MVRYYVVPYGTIKQNLNNSALHTYVRTYVSTYVDSSFLQVFTQAKKFEHDTRFEHLNYFPLFILVRSINITYVG